MTSNFLHWQRIKGLFITENWDVPVFPSSLLLTSHFYFSWCRFPRLFWATRAVISHVIPLKECWSPKREVKTVRNEQLELGVVRKEGFPKRVTDKRDAFSYRSSVPCPTCPLCTLFLPPPLPLLCWRAGELLCCALMGGDDNILKCSFKSIPDCAYVAKSTTLALRKGESPHSSISIMRRSRAN